MVTQQMIAPPARAGMFLVFTIDAQADPDAVRGVLADLSSLTRSVSFRAPEDDLNCVAGIGARLWARLFAADPPRGLHPFRPIVGPTHTAVATPGDLLIHLRAGHLDLCFELAHLIGNRLRGLGRVVDEVHGFKYFDERDLLGFVDGTENPEGRAADDATLVGDEDPDYAGGSYIIVQKYLHDLDAWGGLTVEQQERVIGRTKIDDVEFPDADKASNSHVVLNTVHGADGRQRQIMRDNMPFGAVGAQEFGTYFIGYSADPAVTEEMLRRMFIGVPEGNHDAILDYSTAVTGGLFFAPAIDFLDGADNQPGPASATAAPDAPAPPPAAPLDPTLGVGSLRPPRLVDPPADHRSSR